MGSHTTSVGCLLATLLFLAFLLLHCFEFSSATTFLASSNMSSCFKSERDALLDLKHSLVDETNRLSSWIGDDCCSWYGIRCSGRTGHIVKLDLRNPFDQEAYSASDYYKSLERYALRGDRLNNSLQNLKHLTHLDLSFNNFSYIQIPDFFGSLVNLRYLNLSHSCFAGKNPHHLGNLSALRYLDLSYNYGLENIDNLWWVSQLYYLKHLDLFGSDLSKATNWFQAINLLPFLLVLDLGGCRLDYSIIPANSNINFTSLLELDLSGNMHLQTNVTTTVPHWISNITGLVKLNLAGNSYSGRIPESIGMLRSLTFMDLSGNSFTSILPDTLSQLRKLVHLSLSYNMLEGPIPNKMSNLTQLTNLNLDWNQFTGNIPSSFENLAFLESLIIRENQLSGVITEEHFQNFTSLIELDLLGNSGLAMNFSPTWIPPFQLVYLWLSYTKVGPSFPPWIRYQRNLERLELSDANIVDNISENHFFYNLTSLEYLDLSRNPGLSLNFTPTWTPPFQLKYLHLSSTKVGPRFPLWIRNQKNLDALHLSNASIEDNIPPWFTSVTTSIKYMYLFDNKLKGKLLLIPSNLAIVDVSNNLLSGLLVANATTNSLKEFDASNNLLSGSFPIWLCSMKSIWIIDLSNNQLLGILPSCLRSLGNLEVLILENNSFWGSIPSSLGSLPFLNSLHLRNNKFEGHLPSSFQNLTRLLTLDVGGNAITGIIPKWIGETFTSLIVLILQGNKFHGSIPQQLCKLSHLQTLDMAHNNITGSIPSCFHNFTSMTRGLYSSYGYNFTEQISAQMQAAQRSYHVEYLVSMDLSNNNINGVIPEEMMELWMLVNLNLSGNHIEGRIPDKIGNMRQLISLDLSRNKLSGPIPQSLSNLSFLAYLNVSFNNLSGKIPTGYQLQTLNDPLIYMGNIQLCGAPLNKCTDENNPPDRSQQKGADVNDDVDVMVWFYSGLGPGVLVGFLGFCSSLHFNKRWRYAYFAFLEVVYDTLAVAIAVKAAQLHRKFQKQRTDEG